MFGRKQKAESKTTSTNSKSSSKLSSKSSNSQTSNSACVIVKGTVIEGEFFSKNDTRLDGIITGKVTCDARLIMGKDAVVDGIAKSKGAKIAGVFNGDLTVEGVLSLANSAKVEGNVKADELEVEDGASLNGDIAVGKKENL